MASRKAAIIGGLHGNMGIGGDDLSKAINQLEDSYAQAVDQVYGGSTEDEGDLDKSNPFFGAMKVPGAELLGVQDSDREVIGIEADTDQG